jgi:diguanylate cyclase (GGDEF)-like protein
MRPLGIVRLMPTLRRLLLQAGLAVAYAVAGSLGLLLAFANPSASPVWAPTGIAIAAGLRWGRAAWPPIFIGAFVVNVTTAGTALTSLAIAGGNTLEAMVGAYLVARFAGGERAFQKARSAFAFVVLGAGVAPLVASTIGVATLALGGFVDSGAFWDTWVTWWLGDSVGALVVCPAILLMTATPHARLGAAELFEVAGLGLALAFAAIFVFTGVSPLDASRTPAEFIVMPLLMWAAFRFGPREAVLAVLLLSVIAIAGTVGGSGPFIVRSPNASLLLLQAFMGVAAATTIVVAAAMGQRRRAEAQLREWSVTDPLTGLGNFRLLEAALDREVQRSLRSERPFALLLLDLDHLKRINDSEGHLIGSRALARVGDVLRRTCRAVDTATRYGGDEFAVVLPESDEGEAQQLALRIARSLLQDPERPHLSVSAGIAVFGRDGETAETLLRTADQRMYIHKRERTPRPPVQTSSADARGSAPLRLQGQEPGGRTDR